MSYIFFALLLLTTLLPIFAVSGLMNVWKTRGKVVAALQYISEFAFVLLFPPIAIYFTADQCSEHPIELLSLPTAYTLWAVFAVAYLISKALKEKVSPLLLLVLATALSAGWLYCLLLCVHLLQQILAVVIPVMNLLYLSPFFCLLFLSKELRSLSRLFAERKKPADGKTSEASLVRLFNHPLLISGFLTAPLLALIQAILYLFGQKPDSMISQFTESCGFLLSHHQSCSCGGDHYLCSIAANGDKKLVRPVRYGVRQNQKIVVNRQLLIANAFENWLEEKMPRAHRVIRRTYDAMNIPVNEWSKKRRFANVLYLLMKPLEWLFLIWLYLVDRNPESRIARQYLPKKELDQFTKNLRK